MPVEVGAGKPLLPSYQQVVWQAEHGEHLPDGWPRHTTELHVKTVGRVAWWLGVALVWVGIHPARFWTAIWTAVVTALPFIV